MLCDKVIWSWCFSGDSVQTVDVVVSSTRLIYSRSSINVPHIHKNRTEDCIRADFISRHSSFSRAPSANMDSSSWEEVQRFLKQVNHIFPFPTQLFFLPFYDRQWTKWNGLQIWILQFFHVWQWEALYCLPAYLLYYQLNHLESGQYFQWLTDTNRWKM